MCIGARLREERERLGLSQSAFGEIGGVQKRAQINYEAGDRAPDANYLAEIAKVGGDVQYIVTGVPSAAALSADEEELLGLFRAAPLAVKAAAIGALQSGTSPGVGGGKISIRGDVHGDSFVGNKTVKSKGSK